MKNLIVLFSVISIIVSSCMKDDYDFKNISLDNYNPAIAAPLVNTRLTLHDLIEDQLNSDTSIISIDEDSLLWVTYSSKLFQMGVSDLFEISNQNISESFVMDEFTITDINQNVSVSMGKVVSNLSNPEKATIQSANGATVPFPEIPSQSGGEHDAGTFSEFSSVDFIDGSLILTVTNNWPIDLTNFTIEIKNSDNSPLGTVNYAIISAGSSASDVIDLSGKTLGNSIKANILNIESPGVPFPSTVAINLTDDIAINISTSGLKVSGGSVVFPSGDVVDQTLSVDMSLGNGETINSLKLKSGSIDYVINYGIKEDADLIIELPYANNGISSFRKVININSNNITETNVSGSFSLAGYTLDLTAGGTSVNTIEARILASITSSGIAVPFTQTDGVTADLTLSGLEIEYLDGYLGVQAFSLEKDTVNLNFDQLDFDGEITLADPRLTLKITNSFGMSLGADLGNIMAESEETSLLLNGLDSVTIGAPSTIGDSITTLIEINKSNTNIDDILGINPSRMIFEMTGSTNPGIGPHINFITDESYVGISMDVEVPLYGSVSGFVLTDTLDFPTDAFENVLKGTIRTFIKNEFPVDVNVQAYFVDEFYAPLDSLGTAPINVLKAISVDVNGEQDANSEEYVTDIELTESMVENIKAAKYIILSSGLSTSNEEAAKFYTSYGMDIKLAVWAKVKVNLQEEQNQE